MTDSEFGWKIRKIVHVDHNHCVQLDNGISFASSCFLGAEVGETWAVKHERHPPFVFGKVEVAVKLEDAE